MRREKFLVLGDLTVPSASFSDRPPSAPGPASLWLGKIGRILIPGDRVFEIFLLLCRRAEPARKINILRLGLMLRVNLRRFAARAIRR